MTTYLLAVLLILSWGSAPGNAAEPNEETIAGILEETRKKYDLPAMAGGIVTETGLQAMAAVGYRKKGTLTVVTREDKWHLGSNTKAMVGTLAGILAEKGGMKWETTVAEVFPELREDLHPAVRDVTLKQLLAHLLRLTTNLDLPNYLDPD
jgi:CubicO group peptidase (beta-lactamase class C family)